MVVLLWDASALAKRYAPEVGSETVDALFAAVPAAHMASSSVSYAEIYSILLRKLSRAALNRAAFEAALRRPDRSAGQRKLAGGPAKRASDGVPPPCA